MNCIPFAAIFLRGPISLRWAQHKRRHKSATPISWSELKAFLHRDLRSSQVFIDNIWSKFRRDSKYQLKEARDWASHLQHFQSILTEFDLIRTHYGYFKYQIMPFGLFNSLATFQGYVNKILADKLDIFVIVYLGYILIYT